MSISIPNKGTPRLSCEGLAANRGGVLVVEGVSFDLEPGQALGLLGPAGGGKTSFLLVLAGLLSVSRGEVRLEGAAITRWPAHMRARAGLHTAIPALTLVPSLTVREHLKLAAGEAMMARRAGLCALLGDRADTPARLLSGGMQRVLATAVALAGQPKVVIVDDVAEGLQPSVAEAVLASLASAREHGCALVVVDRSLAILEQICDRVLLLDSGMPVLDVQVPIAEATRQELESRAQRLG